MKRRASEEFNISFLDVICCGFGAIILLLIITKTVAPQLVEVSAISLKSRIDDMQKKIFELRGETQILNRDLNAKHEQLSRFNERLAILQGEFDTLKGKYQATSIAQSSNSAIISQLAVAKQNLTEEMKRLQNQQTAKNNLIGGIPVDSEYIIFVIDTSGSMFNFAWPRMLKEFESVLKIHPKVKGIQIMNDMGNYMFSRYQGKWIPDTPGRRKIIMDRLRTWNVFSNSSPVEGINRAIRNFYAPDKKISIYVFGDEFSGESIASVVDTVDKINRENSAGKRLVRIHAVGFPVQFLNQPHLQITGIRFATLMRELTFKNGGSFVGLNDFR
jgi:hypothetical protein